jgi:RNA polymerase sigma factor (sigma-70 family)
MDWDEERARLVVGRVVVRLYPSFRQFPEFGEDDLHQIGVEAVREKFPDWGNRCAFTTFAYRVARNAMVDQLRKRGRRAGHEAAAIKDRPRVLEPGLGLVEFTDAIPGAVTGDDAEWAGSVYCVVRRGLRSAAPPPRRVGRPPAFTEAQRIALALLKMRKRLTDRGAVLYVHQRADVREALGLSHTPSRQFFGSLPESDTKLRRHIRRIRMSTEQQGVTGRNENAEAAMAAAAALHREWDMSADEVAAELGVQPSTLATWREQRRNLSFIRIGTRPRYRRRDVERFKASRVVEVAAANN